MAVYFGGVAVLVLKACLLLGGAEALRSWWCCSHRGARRVRRSARLRVFSHLTLAFTFLLIFPFLWAQLSILLAGIEKG